MDFFILLDFQDQPISYLGLSEFIDYCIINYRISINSFFIFLRLNLVCSHSGCTVASALCNPSISLLSEL